MKRLLRILTSTIIGPLPQIIFFIVATKDETSIQETIGTTWYEIAAFIVFCLTALIPIIYGIVWSYDSGIGSYFLNQILIPIGLGILGIIIFLIFSAVIS